MWSPTHVHVVVQRAENLLIKGKNGTNNSFVVIQLGKESYRTSIKEKSGESVFWNEECELKIPKIGNTAAIELTAYHRNSLGLDQFLGTVRIPLVSFEKFQKSVKWYRLQGKPGKEKGKDKLRGELEVQVAFIKSAQSQSLTSLQSKGKSSFQQLTGSLFSLGQGDTKFRKFTNSLGKTVYKKKKKDLENVENPGETCNNNNNNNVPNIVTYIKKHNLDPGVISDEEDSESHKSSESSGHIDNSRCVNLPTTPPPKPRRIFKKAPEISVSHWEENNLELTSSLNASQGNMGSSEKSRLENLRGRLSDRRLSISCVDFSHLLTPKPEKKFSSTLQLEKNQGDPPHNTLSKLARKLKNFHAVDKKEVKKSVDGSDFGGPVEEQATIPKSEFKNKNKDELINMVVDLQKRVNCISVRVKDLEDYLDGILLKVMETVPKILEKS